MEIIVTKGLREYIRDNPDEGPPELHPAIALLDTLVGLMAQGKDKDATELTEAIRGNAQLTDAVIACAVAVLAKKEAEIREMGKKLDDNPDMKKAVKEALKYDGTLS